MSAKAWLGLILIAVIIGIVLLAWRTRRPGESMEHAVDRLLNNDEHKTRERERQAGLRGDAKADPPPK